MNTNTSDYCPDSTYFTATDVEPDINVDGSVTIYNGRGTGRSWGRPQVTSTIVLEECDFIAVHVGFSHKHRGGQAWYYYTTDGNTTSRIKWQQMPDELRQRVLDAYEAKAPNWAKSPGKLRTERATPASTTRTSYKLVERTADGQLISLYDGATEYAIGKRNGQAVSVQAEREMLNYGVADTHDGGFYSHPTAAQVMALWEAGSLVPDHCKSSAKRLALLECEISGRIVRYANGKLASTYLKPTAIINEFDYTPAAE